MGAAVIESDRPPASAKPRDKGWRPDEDDDSPRAVAYRARRALELGRELRGDFAELRASIDALSTSVGTLTGAVNSTKALGMWILRIVGALAVTGGALWVWKFLSTLHH